MLIAGGLLALAAVVPPVAIVVVWPLLFVVPGWLLVARAVPGLTPAGRLGAGIVTSVYASAHLVNVVSLALGGFTRASVLVVAGLLLAGSWALARLPIPFLAPPPSLDPRGILPALRAHRGPFVVAGLAVAVVGGVLAVSAWRQVPGGWSSGGWNWSDFLVHVSIGQSLVNGNFPPQVPYFAGVPLSYHWFADFHGALTALVAGVGVIPVFVLTNGLMAGTFALLAWELARRLTGSGRVAVVATLLVVFGGGMGWLRLPLDAGWIHLPGYVASGQGGPLELIGTNPYDNTWADGWPWFRIASVLGTGFFPHRATALGLPGLVAVVLLAWASLGRRPAGMALAGVLAALLAPFQFFFFPAVYLLVLLVALARRAWHGRPRSARRTWLRDAILFLVPVVLALPFIVGPALLQRDQGTFRLVVGWEEARFADGPAAVTFFYLTNLGIPFILALLALVMRRTPNRGFLGAWLVALFLVPNLVVVSAVAFDMNKYFQVMWIAAGILAAWAIRRLPRPAIAAIVLASALSPAFVATWHAVGDPNEQFVMTTGRAEAAAWIEANTPERVVFVTDAWINQPTDLAGRLRISTFGPYAANLGYDPAPREEDIRRIRCEGPDVAAALMAKYGATYVLSSGGLLECAGEAGPTDFSASDRFETVYDADGVTIWRLRGAP